MLINKDVPSKNEIILLHFLAELIPPLSLSLTVSQAKVEKTMHTFVRISRFMEFNVAGAQWMNKSNSNQERVKNNVILLKKQLFENKRHVFHPSFPLEQEAKQFWWLFHSSPHNEPFDKYKFGISKQISFIWKELINWWRLIAWKFFNNWSYFSFINRSST